MPYAPVAQRLERMAVNHQIVGSLAIHAKLANSNPTWGVEGGYESSLPLFFYA